MEVKTILGKLLIAPSQSWLARSHWRRQLEQRRALRFTGRQLQQLPVEREREHWRLVRV